MDHIEILNSYIKKYPESLPFDAVTLDELKSDTEKLNLCIDYIISLFSKIGLSEDFAPTMDGIMLDSCLEYLTELRER